MLEQIGPLKMNEVYDKTFDVGTIVILICHDHNFTIAKTLHGIFGLVLFFEVQANNLTNACDFSILQYL